MNVPVFIYILRLYSLEPFHNILKDPTKKSGISDPDRSRKFECPQSQGLFPHPGDCAKFYHCDHLVPHLKDCPPGLHFNPKLKVCDWPKSNGCRDRSPTAAICRHGDGLYPNPKDVATYYSCSNGKPSPMHCPPKMNFNPESSKCESLKAIPAPMSSVKPPADTFDCPKPNGLFPHPACCDVFYNCANSVAHLTPCPAGLHFSAKIKVCDWPAQAGCERSKRSPRQTATFVCPQQNGLFPNPQSSVSYYHCDGGTPDLRECPIHQQFDPYDSECV